MQVKRSPKAYDVCIIGSGASGGTAAKVLTEGGLSVVLLEAGPPVVPERDYKEHVWPYDLPHRGAGVAGRARQGLDAPSETFRVLLTSSSPRHCIFRVAPVDST